MKLYTALYTNLFVDSLKLFVSQHQDTDISVLIQCVVSQLNQAHAPKH